VLLKKHHQKIYHASKKEQSMIYTHHSEEGRERFIAVPCLFNEWDVLRISFRVDLRDGEMSVFSRHSADNGISQDMADGHVIEFGTNIHGCKDVVAAIKAEIALRSGFIDVEEIETIPNQLIKILSDSHLVPLDMDQVEEDETFGDDSEFTTESWYWEKDNLRNEWEDKIVRMAEYSKRKAQI
jgi:hypothetical protein